MSERLACCVPFCKRTRHNREGYNAGWVCADHWPRVSRHLRRRMFKLERVYRRRFGRNNYWTYPPGSADRLEAIKLERLIKKAWARCKANAIEKAMGIA